MIGWKLALPLLTLAAAFATSGREDPDKWTNRELALIHAARIDALGDPPPDPSNRYADDTAAARLGKKIFHDTRFSQNGEVSCATCHQADYGFSDDLPRAQGVGTSRRRAMPAVGMAWQRWFFWDGRKDSLWAQALTPLEAEAEHGISRTRTVQLIYEHYRTEYERVIGPLPNLAVAGLPARARPAQKDSAADLAWHSIPETQRDAITGIYVNVGKVIAAFVRTLKPQPSRFDLYARALFAGDEKGLQALTTEEKAGLRLFLTKAKCVNCHNGPMFTNGEFHHVGVPDTGEPDPGRAAVIQGVIKDEFSALGRWSDADPKKDAPHVRFLDSDPIRYQRAFKTPTLRDVAKRPPYMHAGQFNTLGKVLRHYGTVSGKGMADEIFHDNLTDDELVQLEAFLVALTSVDQR